MKWLTEWAVTSSVLILIVLAARLLLKDKLSARLRYALWGVVLLRLLIPFQTELPAAAGDALPVLASNLAPETAQWEEPSIPVFPERSKPVAEFNLDIETTLEPGDILSYSDGVGCLRRDGETITWYRYILSPEQIVLALWLVGAGLAGAVILVSNLRFYGRLRKRREGPERADAPIPVYVTEGLPSPCLFGVLRPAVYVIPEAAENSDTLRHVLAHELTHYAHKDHIWSLLRCLALALHWYNPLVWLAVLLSKGDGELACDEGAIVRLGEAERIPYGRTLVDMVAARSLRPGDLLSCSTAMTGGGKSIQQRVAQLVKKPETVKAALFAAVAVVALSAVFVFAGRTDSGRAGDYSALRKDIKNAQAIHLSREMISSYEDPTVITHPELLEQAKDILVQGSGDWLDPSPVLEDLNLGSLRTLTLTDEKGREICYQVVFSDMEINSVPQAYVITEGSLSQVPGSRVAALLDQEAVPKIYELMRRQRQRDGSDSPELSSFLADLENASSARYYPPLYSSQHYSEAITDPRLLENVRERLFNLVPLGPEDTPPDGKHLLDASRLVLATEEGEATYNLIPYNGYTYVTRGSGDYFVQEDGQTAFLRTKVQTNLTASIASLAWMQEQLSQDPAFLVPMTREELSKHSPEGIWEAIGYRLQGWDGDLRDVEFYTGYTSLTRMQLWYYGDETHEGAWVLELLAPGISSNSSGYSVVSDQPSAVFSALHIDDAPDSISTSTYEIMEPDLFAACLKPEDVVCVTAGDSGSGQNISPDLPVLKEQLTQALYHQFSAEYDGEKHGQYAITVQVQGAGMASYSGYEIAAESDRLILSIGSEADTVCLRHKAFASNSGPSSVFVRSPELYRTIQALHGLSSEQILLGYAAVHVPGDDSESP